jgi:two-component system CheB/CheR fusion protein
VSCRNLLIYLNPEAQSRVTTLFDFALREGGILLLGSSETISNIDGRFERVSKPDRIYRKAGSTQSCGFAVSPSHGEGMRLPPRLAQGNAPTRQTVFAELCRRHVLEAYAPAAVLINQRNECLYSLGPTHHYLRVAPGQPSHDLLAMASDNLRIKLRSAIQQAVQRKGRVVVSGGSVKREGAAVAFDIDVRPIVSDGEELMLICFANEHVSSVRPSSSVPGDSARVVELEQELTATRAELQGAIRDLEYSSEEQRAINEEALSINEEFQSTNEELLTSKEELQSLNEELTALNGQLQETLERQRTTASDLQNVLYSTDVATLFLDLSLNIRFFTPACRALFNVIPSDVGRPLADLSSLSADGALAEDARLVLVTRSPIDREIEVQDGAWFTRRILPYRTDDDEIDGVVITFTDVTERKRARTAMLEAKQQAERATVAKSRFLAAASHDLRQPLQTIGLLQALLAKLVEGDKAETLVARLDETLGAMTGMLDALLDINRIEAGTVSAKEIDFPVNDLLCRLTDEYSIHAEAKHLDFHVVHSSAIVHGDPRLLEQMIRNLLSNAVKYTEHGRILLGCRRRGDGLSIEVWDTGIGIPKAELDSIFEEYHQIGNAARERNRGLGLGLSIVRRLGTLIGSATRVHSTLGKGSAFAIDVKRAEPASQPLKASVIEVDDARLEPHAGIILIVEDDPEVRDLLELFLKSEGHRTAAATDGAAAMDLILRGTFKPDLVLADHNLPNDMNGLQLAASMRSHLDCQVPVIILTGDISTETMREIARQDCVQLNKPVKLNELTHTIGRLLTETGSGQGVPKPRPADATNPLGSPTIFVVDDDDRLREAVRSVLEDAGCTVVDFATAEAFLASYRPGGDACILIDAHLPGISGIELLQCLKAKGAQLSAVIITGDGDVAMAVQAMKSGASDFIEKPIRREGLLACIERALEQSRDTNKLSAWQKFAAEHVARLTLRERQVMDLVLTGHPSKNIAADLGISQRTVENHRASIMKKTGVKSLPELVRMALAAAIVT